jgi:hypothetical protein
MPTDDAPISGLARLGLRLLSPASLYDDWVVAETESSLALTAWKDATTGSMARAYASYVAALAREARAADLLAARLRSA